MTDQDQAGFEPQPEAEEICPLEVEHMAEHTQLINSSEIHDQLIGTEWFRKLLSKPDDPPVQDVVAAGVLPRFVDFLQNSSSTKVQFEAAWVLTNVASGTTDHCQAVIDCGALRILVPLLGSTDDCVREQSIWAIGNIAGDSVRLRDIVLEHQIHEPLLEILANENCRISMVRIAAWLLSNLWRGNPTPSSSPASMVMPVLAQLVARHTDEEVLQDCCWTLKYLTDADERVKYALAERLLLHRLVDLLQHRSTKVVRVAKNVSVNVCRALTAAGSQVLEVAVENGCIPLLVSLLGKEASASEVLSTITQRSEVWASEIATMDGIREKLAVIECHDEREIIETTLRRLWLTPTVRRKRLQLPSEATDDQCLAREITQKTFKSAVKRAADVERNPLVATFSPDAAISAAQRKAKVAAVKTDTEPCDHKYTQHFGGRFSCADCWAPLEEVAPDRIAFEQQKLEEAEAEDRANENHSDFLFGCGVPVEFVIAFRHN
eukprot:SAG31_NODE_2904_length_4928_cov_3.585007_1_plen_492_part_00